MRIPRKRVECGAKVWSMYGDDCIQFARELYLVHIDGLVDGAPDEVGVVVVPEVLQHVHGRVDHGYRVRDVLAGYGGA